MPRHSFPARHRLSDSAPKPGARFTPRAVWAVAALLVCALVPWGAVAIVDYAESQRAFCNRCHLPDGTPLHALKAKLAREQPRLDLTGVHFSAGTGPPISCATCHRGVGWGGRAAVLWESFANTVRYTLGRYREPEALANALPSESCTACHAGVTREGRPEHFHGIKAHLDQSTIGCNDCHLAHAEGPDAEAHAHRATAATARVCRHCHRGNPPAQHVLALLARYEAALLERMR